MYIIDTENYNIESMRINAASIICDNNKSFKFDFFAEECFKLCSYQNWQTGVKCGLKNNKI